MGTISVSSLCLQVSSVAHLLFIYVFLYLAFVRSQIAGDLQLYILI